MIVNVKVIENGGPSKVRQDGTVKLPNRILKQLRELRIEHVNISLVGDIVSIKKIEIVE